MTKRKITGGKWAVVEYESGALAIHYDVDNRICFMATPGNTGSSAEISNNANFIAAAGAVTNRLYDQGIDGVKAVEMLPEILKELKSLHDELMRTYEYAQRGDVSFTQFRHDVGNFTVHSANDIGRILTKLQEPSDD